MTEFEEVDIEAVRFYGSSGGLLTSTSNPDITCHLPEGAVAVGDKSFCRVSLQIVNTDETVVQNYLGKGAAMSPIIIVEPIRRKFHKPLCTTLPLPGAKTRKVDPSCIRILYSITGSGERLEWQDITGTVNEKVLNDAAETGKLSLEHVVTGRFAVVCCEDSMVDVPETVTEMMQWCWGRRASSAYTDQPHLDLMHAARTGDLSALHACLSSEGMDVNHTDHGGETALHLACREGHAHIVDELLKHNADVNIYSQKGNAAIHLASYYGHVSIVQKLLDHGCDVNLPSKISEFPPLYPAILEMQYDVVRLLMSKGAVVKWNSQDGLSLMLVAMYSTYDKEKTKAMLQLLVDQVDIIEPVHSEQLKNKKMTEFEEVDIEAVRFYGSSGGLLTSTSNPDITCRLPQGALTIGDRSFCRVSIQVVNTDETVVQNYLGKGAAMSPIIVVEPIRRKFHKPLCTTLLLPGSKTKKVDPSCIRILYSITGSGESFEWQDITGTVNRKVLNDAAETGKLSLEHVVTGRFAVVCCEDGIIDVPETMTEMMRWCWTGRTLSACTDQPHLDLLHAARTGDLSALQACLSSEGMDANHTNQGGETALHLACREGHAHIVDELLRHNADVNNYSQKGNAAIHLASYYGHVSIVEKLLDHGCDVNLPSKISEFPPLYPAILEMQCEVVRLLLSKGAVVKWNSQDGLSLLLVAVFSTYDKGKTKAMLQLLLDQVDLAELVLSEQLKNKGFHCHGEALQSSVTNRQATKDFTGVVRQKLANYCKQLWEKDIASIEECKEKTKDFLKAVMDGNLEKCSERLSVEPEVVNKVTETDVSALHCACYHGNTDLLDRLIQAGADINLQTKSGISCLYLASQGGFKDIVKKLLKAGADIETVNHSGLTASDIALEVGRLDIFTVLKDFSIRKDCHASQKSINTASKPANKDDIAVKKCCSVS